MKTKLFSYSQLDTFIHRLSGLTKLICFLLLTTTVMLTFDIRIILGVMFLSLILFRVARIEFRKVRVMFVFVLVFLITNFFLTFLFSPTYGVEIYGTEHILFRIAGPYVVTAEQLFYQITKFSKYLSVIPLGCIFFFTTNPSEFASSLNSIGLFPGRTDRLPHDLTCSASKRCGNEYKGKTVRQIEKHGQDSCSTDLFNAGQN